jgi:hypothetical protein
LWAVLALAAALLALPAPARAVTPRECEAVVARISEAAGGLKRVNPGLRDNKPDELEGAAATVEQAGRALQKLDLPSAGVKKIAQDLGSLFLRLGRNLRDLALAIRSADPKTRARIHAEFQLAQEEMLRLIRALKEQCQPSPPTAPT